MATTSKAEAIAQRLQDLIQEGSAIMTSGRDGQFIAAAPMAAWRTRSIAYLERAFGSTDVYSVAFREETDGHRPSYRDRGVAILRNLRDDVLGGYLANLYLGIAGEVVADLLDLGSWSMQEGSKEAAAILAGSALELGLRRVAIARDVEVGRARGIDDMNAALADAGVYGRLRRGQIDTWRVLRNHAIHGEHDAYTDADVRLMLDGVQTFMAEELR